MSKELVFKQFDNKGHREVRLSHRNLADYMRISQDAVMLLIEKHIDLFDQISPCPFETKHVAIGFGEKEAKTYYLDSYQTGFLIGLTRPMKTSIPLKLGVILKFKEANEKLTKLTSTKLTSTSAASKMETAIHKAIAEIDLKSSLWKKLGMTKEDTDAEVLETLRSIEHDYMVTGLVPASLAKRVAKHKKP